MFSTPEYAGSLPGSFKNMLDWLVGEGLYDKPVGWINASAHHGAQGAHQTLRTVLGYMNADIVDGACVEVPVRQQRAQSRERGSAFREFAQASDTHPHRAHAAGACVGDLERDPVWSRQRLPGLRDPACERQAQAGDGGEIALFGQLDVQRAVDLA